MTRQRWRRTSCGVRPDAVSRGRGIATGTANTEPTMNARNVLSAALTLTLATASLADDGPATSPDGDLPPHITRLTLFGERADFSHDGKRVLFLEKTFGDVYEVDMGTKRSRLLTGHYPHHGYTRALYLANGDLLLSGPERFDPEHPGDARVQCYLSVLDKGGHEAPGRAGHKVLGGAGGLPQAAAHRLDARRGPVPRRHAHRQLADLRGRHCLRGRHAEAGGETAGARQPRPAVPLHAGGAELPPAGRARGDLQRLRPPGDGRLRRRPRDEAGHELLRRPRPVRRAGGHLAGRPVDPASNATGRASAAGGPGTSTSGSCRSTARGPGSG